MYKNDLKTKYLKVPVKISTVKSAVFIKDAMVLFVFLDWEKMARVLHVVEIWCKTIPESVYI